MAKFVNSGNSIPSSLLLWEDIPTQTSIEDTYDLKVWPVTSMLNGGPIQFNIPPQPKGLLCDIHIVTKLKIQENGQDLILPKRDVSIINNLANCLWGEVSVVCAERTELCQSMKNAYAYQTFFNHALNSASDKKDYLFYNEAFLMDSGMTKHSEKNLRTFWKWDQEANDSLISVEAENIPEGSTEALEIKKKMEHLWSRKCNDAFNYQIASLQNESTNLEGDEKKIDLENRMGHPKAWIPTNANPAASIRSMLINSGQSLILNSKFQCPLFNTSKCLPTNMKIRISLSKNRDEILLLCNDDAGYSIVLQDCYLNVTYHRVRDEILNLMEERMANDAAVYFISKPQINVRPITSSSRFIRMTDIFSDKIPPYAFFALQRSTDFEGKFSSNCFTFVPFKTFQFYLNGTPYFMDSLEVATITSLENREGTYKDYIYKDFGEYMRQLYQTIGKDSKGDCLIDSTNFHLNFMVGMSFGADRSNLTDRHLNLQEKASTYLEIDMGIDDVPDDLILIVYSLFDRQILIDNNRMVRIVE